MKKINNKIILPVTLLSVLSGCFNANEQVVNEPITTIEVVNGAAIKGPMINANVRVFAIDANGQKTGSEIAQTSSDSRGQWSLSISSSADVRLIEVSGGSFIDESDPEPDPAKKRIITLSNSDILLGLLPPGETSATVSTLTHSLVKTFQQMLPNIGSAVSTYRYLEDRSVNAMGFNPFTLAATDPLAPAGDSSEAVRQHALILGGVANALNRISISVGKPYMDYPVIDALAGDFSDCQVNGKHAGVATSLSVNGVSVALPGDVSLATEIKRFRNNHYEKYNSGILTTTLPTIDQNEFCYRGPYANNDQVATTENNPVSFAVLSNDFDPDGDALSISLPLDNKTTQGGSLVKNTDGSITYTPPANFSGSDSFQYAISDGNSTARDSAKASVTITVTNTAPVAVNDSQTTDEDSAVEINVLANDTDAEGNALSISSFQTSTANATITQASATTLLYTPDLNFSGSDSFTYTVSDGSSTATATVSMTVNPVNDAPVFTSGAVASVGENLFATGYTASVSDADGDAITYSIFGGFDSAAFSINSTTGVLSFISAPDFESPGDNGADNIYNVIVQAFDGTVNVTQIVDVTIIDINETAPVITSSASPSVVENTTTVGDVTYTDADGGTFSFAIIGGSDQAKFTINATTGALSFIAPPDFDNPGDSDANNTYMVTVQVSDSVNTTSQSMTVNVTDVNDEAPVILSGAAPSVVENNTAVITVVQTDADGGTISYSIIGGVDQAVFTINTTTGALSFLSAPDFEAPTDSDTNNIYLVDVQVSDTINTTSQSLTVTVTDANDIAPVITSSATPGITENNTAVISVTQTDVDGGTISYSIIGGLDQASFFINATTGALSFLSAPDFETPTDSDTNNTYLVDVQVSDSVNTTNQSITVTVSDVNDEAPVVTSSAAPNVVENTTAVTTITQTDADGGTISYAIIGGADVALFTINAGTGVLDFITPPDYENPTDSDTNNIYLVDIQVSDTINTTNQSLTVTVSDVNDVAPVITSAATHNLNENTTAVYSVTQTDVDGGTISYAIFSGVDAAAFSINSTTGALSFVSPPDFESPTDGGANNIYEVTIEVSDSVNATQQSVSVTVNDVNDVAPVVTSSATPAIDENTTAVITVTQTDVDGGTISYSIVSGVDQALFTINSTTGDLSFITAPDFEVPTDSDTNNTYLVDVQVSDSINTTVQNLTVTINDVAEGGNTPPVFSSATTGSANDNDTAAYTAIATDAELDTITYSISGGTDQNAVTIDTNTGVVTFMTAPDFVNPHDSDANNTYVFEVTAFDGTAPTAQTVTITVVDPDTDADGFSDLHETAAGTLTNDSGSTPAGTIISAANVNNTITGATTWDLAGSPYVVQDNVSIQAGGTLTIATGVAVKTASGISISVDGGTLSIAAGNTAWSRAKMTAYLDDAVQGDTDGTPGSPGVLDYWTGLVFNSGTAAVDGLYMAFATISIDVTAGSPSFSNIGMYSSYDYAVRVNSTTSASPTFTNLNSSVVKSISSVIVGGTGTVTASFTGKGSFTGNPGVGNAAIDLSGSASFTIDGYLVEGGALGGIATAGSVSGEIANCVIRNVSTGGATIPGAIQLNTTGDVTIRHNKIVNNAHLGINSKVNSANTIVRHNIIRGNAEGGIHSVSATPLLVYNNLIIQNRSTSFAGGVGIGNGGQVTLHGNTVAENVISGTGTEGGIALLAANHQLVINDNIIYGNVQDNAGTITGDMNLVTNSARTVGDNNFTSVASAAMLYGVSDVTGDPVFVSDWYLDVSSTAIDAGSTAVLPTYLSDVPLPTTQTDGTVDVSADNLDIGYHHNEAARIADATNSVVTYNTSTTTSTLEPISITPKNTSGSLLGAGLDIDITGVVNGSLALYVTDNGDGTYVFDFTSSASTNSDTITVLVNGVTIHTGSISW